MSLIALEQARNATTLLQLRAPLLSGLLNPIEQVRAAAQAVDLHARLLDSIAFPIPQRHSALELMRFSAELLEVRAKLAAGKLSPIEQVRTSARGLELRSILGASVPISLAKPQRTIDQATISRALAYSSAVSSAEISAFLDKLNTNIAALQVAGIGGETLRQLQDQFDDVELYGEWKAGKAQLVDTPKPVEAPSPEPSGAEQSLEVAGLTIKIPSISKDLEHSYNRATHMGRGRDFNAELVGDVTGLVTDLAGAKHTLDTPEQKAEAVTLVEEYARRSVKITNQDLVAGANNPSWFVTGRSGRNMAKASDKAARQADRSAEAFGGLSKFRDSIAKTLYSMRPAEVKKSQALSADMRSIADYAGMFAGYEQNKQTALAADARKWASPKALKLIERSLAVDAEGTRAALKIIEAQVLEQGGMVALFGARSGVGKLLAQLLADQPEVAPVVEPVAQGPLVITADTPDALIEGASDEQLQAKLLSVAKDFYRGLSHATKDIARRLEKGTYDRPDAIKALKQNRDYLIERVKAGAESDADIMARMARQYGEKSVADLEAVYEQMGGDISALQSNREMNGGGRRTGAAVANEGARQMGQHRLELGIYIKARKEAEPAPTPPSELADQYAAKAVGFTSFSEYAASRIDKLPLTEFMVARAQYKIVEHLDKVGRSDRNTLGSLELQGANPEGPSALAQLRQSGIVQNNLRAQSNPFSLAPGVTLANFVAGDHGATPLAAAGAEPALPVAETQPAQDPAPPDSPHQIIEYKTRKDKILRGVIRMDLTLAEAKAIDPYTWRMNGGYFIREKHLEGDTSSIQAAPAPVVLTPEQEANKAATDARQAEERSVWALGIQVEKLRTVANKAVESGDAGMNQDRNTNTARRAGMAASAIAKASANKADGLTLNNIADAIEVGAAGLLTKLSSRAQLEELQRAMRMAQYETDRALNYAAQIKRKGRPFDENDLKNVALPSQVTWASRFNDAAKAIEKLKPIGNARLIAALKKMGARSERFTMRPEDAAITRKANDVLKGTRDSHVLQDPIESIARLDRLARMGITDANTMREAVRELLPHMVAKTEESAVKKAERAIIGQKVGIDFFPTPANVAQRMATLAHISKGTRVLEPSAGNGNLADAAKSAGGEVDVIEISSQLRDILTAKGYTVVDHDFDGFTPEQPYEAILMNPPFSQRRDAAHIMRAFGMLAPGGRLVAIAGEGVFFGADQKAVAFRTWLDTHNATVEKLEGGTFKDKDLLAQTGANGRLIVLKK